MRTEYKSEKLLVEDFLVTLDDTNGNVIVKELNIRHGNIDVVLIESAFLPFTDNQVQILSRPASALVFSYLKNKQLITKPTLQNNIGLSHSTIDKTLNDLLKVNLISNIDNKYIRKESFAFPKTIIIGYEAKLKDFNKAFYQAKSNRIYVDYSYLVFPLDMARKILEKNIDLLMDNGIGLIGVSSEGASKLVTARKMNRMKNHIRLLSVAKSLCSG